MKIELLEIPGLQDTDQTHWKVRALAINDRSPVLNNLNEWSTKQKSDYKKIMKVMRIAGTLKRMTDEKKVKKSSNPKESVYEMRANNGHARLFFFYDEHTKTLICTHSYWKGNGDQSNSFSQAEKLRKIYFSYTKASKNHDYV